MGFSRQRLVDLRNDLARFVESGQVPGLVYALSCRDERHVSAIGTAGVAPSPAMAPDALFRITSMTRPITAVATLLLVEDGLLSLDEPVDRLAPELADRRVLRRVDGPLDDTVEAERPVTIRDLLTFRGGFGMILAPPTEYPILQAEQDLQLCSVGPPVPVTPLGPDAWLAALGSLPLMDQPGTQWRYSTGSMMLGVLIARASGQPVQRFYRERIFEPLGMVDTGFVVPAADHARLVPCYMADGGRPVPFDDGGQWLVEQPFIDCGAGLVSTATDYLRFAEMLLGLGVSAGTRLLPAAAIEEMTRDHLTIEQRASAGPILDGRGWGYGVSIIDGGGPPESGGEGGGAGPRGYSWSGGFGTVWANDPVSGVAAVLCTPVGGFPLPIEPVFWRGVYRALER